MKSLTLDVHLRLFALPRASLSSCVYIHPRRHFFHFKILEYFITRKSTRSLMQSRVEIQHQLARRCVVREFHDGIHGVHVYVRRRDVNLILILRSASSAWSEARARPNGANARVQTRRTHTHTPTYILHVYTQVSTCTLFSLGPELARPQWTKRQGGRGFR